MSAATEHAALLQRLELHDELAAAADERTLEILERRRKTAVVRRRGWLVRRVLLVADVVGLLLAFGFAEWLVNRYGAGTLNARTEVLVFLATLPAWIVIAKLYGLYDRDEERTDHTTSDDFLGVFHMVTVCTWLFTMVSYVTGLAHPTAWKLILFWAAAIALVSAGRATARTVARRNVLYLQNAVIVGAGDVGQSVAKKILRHPEYGINLVGFVDADPKIRDEGVGHLSLLGGTDRISAIVRIFDVERAILAFSNESHEDTLAVIQQLKKLDLQIDIVPRFFETVGPNVGFHMIEGVPLLGIPRSSLSFSSACLKRALDLVVAGGVLFVALPLLLLVAAAVRLDSPGPVLYRHERIGRAGRRIEILKFRTMHREACRGERYGGARAEEVFGELLSNPVRATEFAQSYKLTNDPRVTRIGLFLRRTSLDELPQLINVLRGDISVVGPRAITDDELVRYGHRADELLAVRPGVTGYWQINGRSQLDYEDRVRLDLSYISGWSLRLDLEILAKTARALISRRGAA